jgi:hypothetical protein
MSKKHFIKLAEALKGLEPQWKHNGDDVPARLQWERTLEHLADFCQEQNPNFMRERWLGYIKGRNGKNGGAIR